MAYRETVALGLFLLAGMTDFLDGQIARRRKLITNFGILMDPLADKVLICSVFIAFVAMQQMPAWMVISIVVRELAITGLRLLAASKSVVLAAEGLGKHKTVSQIVAICAILVAVSYDQWGGAGLWLFGGEVAGRAWSVWVAEGSKWVAVLLTILSGSVYLWRNRSIYLDDC
jgi:CDP-diacylglycerol--glycerol-3-phosphate 3-phosphatidyltransferase